MSQSNEYQLSGALTGKHPRSKVQRKKGLDSIVKGLTGLAHIIPNSLTQTNLFQYLLTYLLTYALHADVVASCKMLPASCTKGSRFVYDGRVGN